MEEAFIVNYIEYLSIAQKERYPNILLPDIFVAIAIACFQVDLYSVMQDKTEGSTYIPFNRLSTFVSVALVIER